MPVVISVSGPVGHITGLACDSVGMFAQHGKLSLISTQGPVQFQAQNGMMHLSAEQKLTLISAREMLLTAKKRIRLVGGGAQSSSNRDKSSTRLQVPIPARPAGWTRKGKQPATCFSLRWAFHMLILLFTSCRMSRAGSLQEGPIT